MRNIKRRQEQQHTFRITLEFHGSLDTCLGLYFRSCSCCQQTEGEDELQDGFQKRRPLSSFPSHFIIRRLLTKGSLLSDRGGRHAFTAGYMVDGGPPPIHPWKGIGRVPLLPPHCVKWRSTWGRKNGRTDDKAGLQQQGKMRRQRLRLSRRSLDPAEHVPSPPPSLLSLLLLFPLLRFCSTGQLAAKSKGGGVEIGRFAAPPPPHSSRQQHHHHHCCMQSFLPPPPPFSFPSSFPFPPAHVRGSIIQNEEESASN